MTIFFERIRMILQTVVMTIFAVLITLTIVQVFMRYVLNNPIMWADELMRLLMIWGTLLGCGLAIYYSKHISMDFVVEKFPKNVRKILHIIVWVLIIGFSVFYVYKGSLIAIGNKNTVLTALNLSKLYYFGSIPISGFFWIIFSVQKLLETLGIKRKMEAKK